MALQLFSTKVPSRSKMNFFDKLLKVILYIVANGALKQARFKHFQMLKRFALV
jgi:hypothetical protein